MSSIHTEASWSPSRYERNVLERFTVEAKSLPAPGTPYERHEIDVSESAYKNLRHIGLIECAERGWREEPNQYETNRQLFHWIDRNLPDPTTLPCGHTGIRCLESGTTYTCTDDDCDATFDRETANEVL